MSDKIHPSATPKPLAPPPAASAKNFPPPPPFRRRLLPLPIAPPSPRQRRGCCCRCCLWSTLLLFLLVLLFAAACGVFYAIYRPRLPTFSLTDVRLNSFSLSSSDTLLSTVNLNVTTTNPSERMAYVYDSISVVVSSGDVGLGDGVLPGFESASGKRRVLGAVVRSGGAQLGEAAAAEVRGKASLPVSVALEGKVGIRAGGLRTVKMPFRVRCGGIRVWVPTKKMAPEKTSTAAKCKVEVKIWNWYA